MYRSVDERDDERMQRGFIRSALLVGMLGVLLTQSWRSCRTTHQRRHESRPQPKAEPLQRWEGEGGQTTEPAMPATASSDSVLMR
jgi:hypothetical protein